MKILPTQNKEWGFWGMASNSLDKAKVQEAWDTAFTIIQENAGFTPQETLALLDSRWGRHVVDEFVDELNSDIKNFAQVFNLKMNKERLYIDFNYYIDPNAYKMPTDLEKEFSKGLEKLSRKYGIVLKAIGGVSIRATDNMDNFKGYTTDLESGDLEPIWED